MNKKTERKNKTNQLILWPTSDEYFTIDNLVKTNPHIVTDSGSDITLRVKLSDAVTKKKSVAVIGTLNCGHGRPKLVYAITPVTNSVLDKAKSNGIILLDESKLIPIMEIKPVTQPESLEVTPVTIHSTTTV